MEEEKAAAYYDELMRKGEGAARFKQGLGFSQKTSDHPTRGSALSSSSSFLSSFVRAASPGKASDHEKQAQLETIQNKLKKKHSSETTEETTETLSRVSDHRYRDRSSRRRSSSRDDNGSGHRRRRGRDSSRERDRERRGRRRSRSRSYSDEERKRQRRKWSSRERRERGRRRRSRSSSGSERRSEKRRGDDGGGKERGNHKIEKEKNGGVDCARFIEGYSDMTPAERVKAMMKLQLSQTVEKDTKKGMGAGWERFEFNKDAPLDDEEIEAAEDDAALVKNMSQSFRFSAVEAKREEQIKAAHDEAMFGAAAAKPCILNEEPTIVSNWEDNDYKKDNRENGIATDLLSDKVLAKQQGSWRDRARKLQNESKG